jgi:hypothetical protein
VVQFNFNPTKAMKKILIVSLLLALGTTTNAQLFKIGKFDVGFVYVGPKLGMNFSQISNWTEFGTTKNKNNIGYQFGVVGEFGFTNKFSIDGELTFISKGQKQVFDAGESNLNVKYLGIPLLAKYTFKAFGLTKVYAKGGTFTNVRTGGSSVTKLSTGETFEQPLDNNGWTRFDWGLSLGAGAEYDAKYGIWGLDLRYDLGIVDVHKSDPTKNRNRSFGITLTYKYDLVDLIKRIRAKKLDPDKQ